MSLRFELSQAGLAEVCKARSSAELLRAVLAAREEQGHPLSYSALSTKAGFASRNFARDVALGSKRLTAQSALKFAKALKLNAALSKHFVLLAERDFVKDNPAELARLNERVRVSATRLLALQSPTSDAGKKFYSVESAVKVYAALGAPGLGATLAEITARTGLAAKPVRAAAEKLIEEGFAELKGTHYHSTERHLSFASMGGDSAFKELFLNSLNAVRTRASENIADRKYLFFQSYFSVPEHKLEELSSQLHDLLLSFVDESENPNGEKVATLLCSLVI